MATVYPIAGASIALAGAEKLLGDRAYEGMFRHLGWTKDQMFRLAGAEVLGGLLMVLKPTRKPAGVGAAEGRRQAGGASWRRAARGARGAGAAGLIPRPAALPFRGLGKVLQPPIRRCGPGQAWTDRAR